VVSEKKRFETFSPLGNFALQRAINNHSYQTVAAAFRILRVGSVASI
jgi:hypothetical protein